MGIVMTEQFPTWQTIDSRASGFFHDAATWTLIGVLASTGGYVTCDQAIRLYGTGSSTPGILGTVGQTPGQGLAVELKVIRESLRLSVADAAKLFGVTRPTIYSWQNGNPVGRENAERLREIARALEPHLQTIESQVGRVAHRAIEGRSTLLQRLAQGADAQEAIGRLTDILGREAAQRERLSRRLQGRSGNRGAADLDSLG